MFSVFSSVWALLLGMLFLQVGNGMQGTLLGIRGEIEGFSTFDMSLVMSGYFLGFLFGSRMAPKMIRRVGHVRVFAALASLISAVLIIYPEFAHPYAWSAERVLIGFCFSGVYVTAESWLNNAAENETRGKALSLYMIVQMLGIVSAQALLLVADPAAHTLFIIPSVLVSLAFAPILLSISPTPAFETAKPLSLRQLMAVSPLGCVSMFLLGSVFSAQFGMSSVYGSKIGLSVAQISTFVSTFFIGALVLQFPIGWISDRMDRRRLILICAAICGAGGLLGMFLGTVFPMLLVAALMVGGMSNPLYSLIIAHTNDFLDRDDMAAAAGALIFINGLGAVTGPIVTGWLMGRLGPWAFFLVIAILSFAVSGYAAWRMTRRPSPPVAETDSFTMVAMSSSPVAVSVAAEYDSEAAQEDTDNT
ncbi:MAG: MFS transporter [Roseovarius sp.]|nr:MFS transporter [Roseovarius sp.]